jgi:flagellar biosynthesis anti-sigma factor FlgM
VSTLEGVKTMDVTDGESSPEHCPLDRTEAVPSLTREGEHPARHAEIPDRVEPSPEGRPASSRKRACTPEAREAKIRELQGAIENGTYRVSAEQLADKMLRDSLRDELL